MAKLQMVYSQCCAMLFIVSTTSFGFGIPSRFQSNWDEIWVSAALNFECIDIWDEKYFLIIEKKTSDNNNDKTNSSCDICRHIVAISMAVRHTQTLQCYTYQSIFRATRDMYEWQQYKIQCCVLMKQLETGSRHS